MATAKRWRTNRLEFGEESRPLPIARENRGHDGFYDNCNTPEKDKQRSAVLDFITDEIESEHIIKILTLPGESWDFERRLQERRPDTRFIGCERDYRTWTRSAPWMPQRGTGLRHLRHRWFLRGPNKYIQVIETQVATHFLLDLCWFVHPATLPSRWNSKRSFFNDKFRRCNAVWIDSFSPLGCEASSAIIRGIAAMGRRRRVVAAFSFLLGRDDPAVSNVIDICPGDSPLERRASFVQALVGTCGIEWRPCGCLSHKSFNAEGSAHIGTVMGVMSPKRSLA